MISEKLAWVSFFDELVANILNNDNPSYLFEMSREVNWMNTDGHPLLRYGEENIDPLSFIYALAQKNTTNQFEEVFESVCQVFALDSEPLSCKQIMPTPNSNAKVIFHNGSNFNPDFFWDIFSKAITDEINSHDFKFALDLPEVDVKKLTQTLFLVNPRRFLPFDNTTEGYSECTESDLREDNGYENYKSAVNEIRQKFPECEPFEINYFLYMQNNEPLITKNPTFFQISCQAHGENGGDYWSRLDGERDFKNHYCVFTGGAKAKIREYPVKDPSRGDIVLARFGQGEGRGIGIVEENGYDPDGWTAESQIDVIWINKLNKELNGNTSRTALTKAGPETETYHAFNEINEYSKTIELISSLVEEIEPTATDQTEESDQNINPMEHPLNTILFGPPGTGKTWCSINLALSIVLNRAESEIADSDRQLFEEFRFEVKGEELSGQIAFITFHQNYAYEDFVEGIRPALGENQIKYVIRDGIFKKIACAAKNNRHLRYVLIIDEINRGNIAKIFGELITLIEDTKRLDQTDAQSAILSYSQKQFFVPPNLYIIGTMNTADRSIQILDTALRRRFDFVEMMPDDTHSDICTNIDGIDCRKMLRKINHRIIQHHDRERQIGHTYFLNVKEMDTLASVFKKRIIPLLQEYFYNDWSKIQTVLGNNDFVQEIKFEGNYSGG